LCDIDHILFLLTKSQILCYS